MIKASQTDQTKVRNQTVVVSKCVMVVVMPLSTKVATVARLALAVLQSKPQRTATWIATFVAAVECPSSGKKSTTTCVPKTLLFGTAKKRSNSDCQKPCSKLKQLLKVFDRHLVADICCVAEIW
jgi:hypothetical protein